MKKGIILIFLILVILAAFKYISNHTIERSIGNEFKVNCMDDRCCVYTNDTISIGNNEKELNNGFYDVLFEREDTGLVIHVNKLWKDVFNENLYEEEYVKFVEKNILQFVGNKSDNKDTSGLLEGYVVDGYKASKNGLEYIKEIKLNNYSILFESKNHELLIEVKNS